MIERDELEAWLRLVLTPQVGPLSARKLLGALGSPQAVCHAPHAALRELVGEREAQALHAQPETLQQQVEATLRWLQEGPQRVVLTLADAGYPAALLDAPDPPLVLFAQGDLAKLQTPAIAIVGSRNPTQQGRENARAFAAVFSQAGLTVVSGLAQGIDGAAHEGALKGAGGTVAVVGTGLDLIYPKRHEALARQIPANGLLLSEFTLGTGPLAQNFPKRNRIIAGLSKGTLVVEAAVQSGSLITARLAIDMAREVFAIPGSIHSPQSRGCHALIKQGAKLVETAQDVIEELRLPLPQGLAAVKPNSSRDLAEVPEHEDPVLEAMGYDPVGLDALHARTGLPVDELNARLLELELQGEVARLPGQLFQRCARA